MPDFGKRGADFGKRNADFGKRNADFGKRGAGNGPESLEAIAQTDQLLNALADGRRVRPADPADAELFALLEGWRDGVRAPSARRLISEDEAAAALQEGLTADSGPKRRHRRGLTLVASTAAAVLAIGGFGALVGGAQPGDSLYGLRTTLFGESQSVRDDRVTLAAQTQLAEVQQMIDRGEWDNAQAMLAEVSSSVETVGNVDSKTELIQQWNELSVKVGTRDPSATLPAVVPGEPAVPPPGVTLLELPAVTPPTTSSTTETTVSTTPTSATPTTSESATSEPTTPSESATSEPTTPAEPTTPTTSESPGEETTATSAPAHTTTETSAATSAPAETASSAVTTTSAAGSPTSVPTAPSTAAVTTTIAEAPASAESDSVATESAVEEIVEEIESENAG